MYILNRITLLLLGLSLSACAKNYELDLPHESPKLVLISHPVADEYLFFNLSASSPQFEGYDTIHQDSAQMLLLDENNQALSIIMDDETQMLRSRSRLKAGAQYRLSVRYPGYDSIFAATHIPVPCLPAPAIIDPNAITEVPVDSKLKLKRIPLSIQIPDLQGTDSLFAFKISYWKENQLGDITTDINASFVADGATYANLHETADMAVLINKKLWRAQSDHTLHVDAMIPFQEGFEWPTLLVVEWRTLSPEYYKYYLSVSRQGNLLIPFNVPDVIFNNIQQGYGSFSGYSKVVYEYPL